MAWLPWAVAFAALTSCRKEPPSREQALVRIKTFIQTNLDEFHAAAVALQKAAPQPDADGWNARDDAEAVAAMRAEWKRARRAYEHVEGAVAILFPDLDVSVDERYDGFLAHTRDSNLFDAEGVVGVHAIERILWADAHPAQVVRFESAFPGYEPARFPSGEEEARQFKEELVGRLVRDTQTLAEQFRPLALDPAAAFRGVIGSLHEQLEKTTQAATGEEESRYAQFTLEDMRANLRGSREVYEALRPWLAAQGGGEVDPKIARGFERILARYDAVAGEALPMVSRTWSSSRPTPEDLSSDFGRVFQLIREETDAARPGSTAAALDEAADVLRIPRVGR